MPERLHAVVVDTTPLIALSLIGRLDLLRQLYGEVIVPPAVEAEVLAGGSGTVGDLVVQATVWSSVATVCNWATWSGGW